MLWFLSLLATSLFTGAGAGAFWLADRDVPIVSDGLAAILPAGLGPRPLAAGIVLVLQAGCYLLAHFLLKRLYAFADETEAAPRDPVDDSALLDVRTRRPRRVRSRPFWAISQRLFANPTGGWLRPFAIPLQVIILTALPLALREWVAPSLWGLSFLFATTLTLVAAQPDKPDRLLPAGE